jgi:transposase-like protein
MSLFKSDTAVPWHPGASVPSACPACRSAAITTTAKSPDANSYWRCASCGEIWNMSRREVGRRGGQSWR